MGTRKNWNVTILGKTWKISMVSPDSQKVTYDGAQVSGLCCPLKFTMYIAMEGNVENIRRTIQHEMTHAVMFLTGQWARDYTNEEVCEFIPVAYAEIAANADTIESICSSVCKPE